MENDGTVPIVDALWKFIEYVTSPGVLFSPKHYTLI